MSIIAMSTEQNTGAPVERPKRRLGLAAGKLTYDDEAFRELDAQVQKLFDDEADRKAKLHGYHASG